MSKTLTFTGHGNSYCKVNNQTVTFPYTLQNGDVITFGNDGDVDKSFTVNGSTTIPSTINNEDIAIVGTTEGSTPVGTLSYTINYTEATRISCDLATKFPDKWAALTAGEHTIQIRAKNPGNYLDSDLSTAITFVKVVNYSITATATNCTASASNPTTIASNTTGTVLTFTKNTGYKLPTSVSVTGATGAWSVSSDGNTGTLTLTKPTGNVSFSVVGVVETYNITVNGTNARKASGPSTITYGGSATLTFAYDDGYYAPTSVTVSGATQTWDATTNTLQLTKCTGPVTVTIAGATKTFSITYSLTNVNSASGNPTTIASNASAVKVTLTKKTGYNLPNDVAISGIDAANWSYDGATGVITMSRPTGNVTITAIGQAIVYTITTTTESATADASNPTTITYGTTATLKFTFPDGYEAPSDDGVTVTGATKTWTQSAGTLVLSNPTANVTVKVVGEEAVTEITGQWTWNETIPNATWTQQAVEFKLADGTSYKNMLWIDDGTTYDLYYDDEQEPDEYGTKVYSYDTADEVGTWVDAKYRIVDFTPDSGIQYVTRSFYNYLETNATQATQLATPQNVTADGTVVSWDEVENATSYEVYADGASIGTVSNGFSVAVTVENTAGPTFAGIYDNDELLHSTSGDSETYQATISSGLLKITYSIDEAAKPSTPIVSGNVSYNGTDTTVRDDFKDCTAIFSVTGDGSVSIIYYSSAG